MLILAATFASINYLSFLPHLTLHITVRTMLRMLVGTFQVLKPGDTDSHFLQCLTIISKFLTLLFIWRTGYVWALLMTSLLGLYWSPRTSSILTNLFLLCCLKRHYPSTMTDFYFFSDFLVSFCRFPLLSSSSPVFLFVAPFPLPWGF
jgi:hypothetical protein